MAIYCCKDCVAPKRYPGCHDHCPEYAKEKAIYEERKAIQDKKNAISGGIAGQRFDSLNRAKKSSRTRWKRRNHYA